MKTDAAFGPFLKFGQDVLCDQDDIGGTADEFGFGRIGLGNDQRENRGAVRRRNSDEAVAGLELGVIGEMEAELVDEEADAAIVAADEDVDALDAEVGMRLSGGSGRGGHGGDYKVGASKVEKDNVGTDKKKSNVNPWNEGKPL